MGRERPSRRRHWAFDCETEAWDKHVLSCAVSEDGETYRLDSYEEIREWYASLPSSDVILAHNGGRYDAIMMVDALRGLGEMTGSLSGGALSSFRVKGGAEMRDTARLAPMTLGDFAKGFGSVPKSELPWEHEETRVDMCEAKKRTLAEYCANDCRANLSAFFGLVDYAERAGIEYENRHGIRRTLGGWSFASADTLCELGPELAEGDYVAERSAFYGGRVEVLRWITDGGRAWLGTPESELEMEGVRWDIRSAYPAAMLGLFPSGESCRALRPAAAYGTFPGIFHAKVVIPPGLPLLPMRAERGSSVVWATGVLEGWWTHRELQAAEKHGAKILHIDKARVWREETPVMAPFVEKYWPLREKALRDGDDIVAKWVKLFLNSAFGKLAQLMSGMCRLVFDPEVVGTNESWHPIGESNIYGVDVRRVVDGVPMGPACARPVLASTITADARIRVMERLIEAGDRAVYCDTDAVYELGDARIEEPDTLGAWNREGPFGGWFAPAPKMYRYTDGEGREKARAKGMPAASAEMIRRLWKGECIMNERGVHGIRSAVKLAAKDDGAIFRRRKLERSLNAPRETVGKRWRCVDGRTIALERNEDGCYHWPGVDARPEDLVNANGQRHFRELVA